MDRVREDRREVQVKSIILETQWSPLNSTNESIVGQLETPKYWPDDVTRTYQVCRDRKRCAGASET